jgi:hypothetical protein
MKLLITIFISLSLSSVYGQDKKSGLEDPKDTKGGLNKLEREELEKIDRESKLIKASKKSAHFEEFNQSEPLKLRQRDERTGVMLKDYSVDRDRSRISLLYHINADLMSAADISTFEGIYAKKFEFAWAEFFVNKSTLKIREITSYNSSAFKSTSEELINDEGSDFINFGAGLSYRTSAIQHLINSDSWFESVGASLGYAQLSNTPSDTKFSGPSLKADFGVHNRSSKFFHLGMKFSYNLASVKRSRENETEDGSARALTLSWVSMALDLSYYF